MSKIEWCDMTWNCVWGCLNGCEYCYARKIAKRFGGKTATKEVSYRFNKGWHLNDPYGFDCNENRENIWKELPNFKPTWIESNFNKKFPKKSSRIFVNSMSDIAYWKPEWMEKVIDRIKEYPQHTFLFLTKIPKVYNKYKLPENCWLGITEFQIIDAPLSVKAISLLLKTFISDYKRIKQNNKFFISIEPMQQKVDPEYANFFDWLIIGAETGNRKNKIIPKPEWVKPFMKLDIPVFIKDNLRPILGDNLKQEFPEL